VGAGRLVSKLKLRGRLGRVGGTRLQARRSRGVGRSVLEWVKCEPRCCRISRGCRSGATGLRPAEVVVLSDVGSGGVKLR
jgi:hypothetical protein